MNGETPLWQPSPERIAGTNMTRFIDEVRRRHGLKIDDYAGLYDWSIREPEAFWCAVWSFCGVIAEPRAKERWFTSIGCRARVGFRMRASISPRTCCAARDERHGARVLGRGQVGARVSRIASCTTKCRALAQALRSAGVRDRRPRRRLHAEHARDRRRMLARRQHRRDLVLVLARFRRAGRARSLRPDRAEGAVHRRRLLLQRQDASICSPACARSLAAAAVRRGTSSSFRTVEPARRACRDTRMRAHGTSSSRHSSASGHRVRAAAVRPSALHPLLVRHHRRAEMHRARRGRHAAAAPEGAPAALRRQAGRAAVLLHHLRLDDVELAGLGARLRRRRCCSTTARRSPATARILFDFADAEKHHASSAPRPSSSTPPRSPASNPRARTTSARCARCSRPARRCARKLRLRLRSTSRHDVQPRFRSPAAPTSSRASCVGNPVLPVWRGEMQCRGARHGGRRVRRATGRPCAGRRASSSARRRFRRCRSASGTIRTAAKYRAAYFERYPDVWCHGD